MNADCGEGQVCAFSQPVVYDCPGVVVDGTEAHVGAVLGWFCTTPADECRSGETRDGGHATTCAYFPSDGHWGWSIGP